MVFREDINMNQDKATKWVLGVDVGGTFTDLVASTEDGQLVSTKTPSTPDQSDGVINGVQKKLLIYWILV